MDAPQAAGEGLRERKKRETREALSWAALRLTVERGLSNVRVEDIAAEAAVSPRTFNNYFSSKAEAIAWRQTDRTRRMADLLRQRPPGEPIWDSIMKAADVLGGDTEAAPDQAWVTGVRLMLAETDLNAEFIKSNRAAWRECAVVIAERTGTDADRDLYPRLMAYALDAAVQTAIEQWQRSVPPRSLAALLRDALRQLAAGLPAPRAE